MRPGRLVDRARLPSGGQVPPGRLVDRPCTPSRGQVLPGRLVDPTLQGRKGERKGHARHSAKSIEGAARGKERGRAVAHLVMDHPPAPKTQLRAF